MNKVTLGRTGITVNEVAMGCLPIQRVTKDEAVKILRRAYDGVRSRKYRSEEQLFADKDFIERAASNEKVKEAVIQAYLTQAARNGESVPASIAGGGGVPLTGKKQPPNSMQQAKDGLARMLGMK